MKKHKPKSYSLTSSDAAAILAALPLVSAFAAKTDAQQDINDAIAASVFQKLTAGQAVSFSPNEYRIIYAAVSAAKFYLAGQLRDSDFACELTAEEIVELRRYFFTYNKLYPILHNHLSAP